MTVNVQARFPDVSFGTSGVRALVSQLTPEVVAAYVYAFVQRMLSTGNLAAQGTVVLGMDLRPSSPEIALQVCRTLRVLGYQVDFLGALPTPGLALRCLAYRRPGVMVTGSHIPFDRNGIKFYGAQGEILKEDEQAILDTVAPADLHTQLDSAIALPAPELAAQEEYLARYVSYFGSSALQGLRVGLYEHSAVGRDLTAQVLGRLGASVIPLGRSNDFVPVDTEAVNDADVQQAQNWCAAHQLDAVVSTDGDGDRPLVFDAQGQFVRGDLLGLICARMLGVEALVVPVSCNTAIEQSGVFQQVLRTRIGSPYVIAGMNTVQQARSVAGFEANGGFLLGSSVAGLQALPTRDALLPMLSILAAARAQGLAVADLLAALPARFTHSDRIKNVPTAVSKALLQQLADDPDRGVALCPDLGALQYMDVTDGVRMGFASGDIVHLRASGNAPELRCYAEADSYARAKTLCEQTLARLP